MTNVLLIITLLLIIGERIHARISSVRAAAAAEAQRLELEAQSLAHDLNLAATRRAEAQAAKAAGEKFVNDVRKYAQVYEAALAAALEEEPLEGLKAVTLGYRASNGFDFRVLAEANFGEGENSKAAVSAQVRTDDGFRSIAFIPTYVGGALGLYKIASNKKNRKVLAEAQSELVKLHAANPVFWVPVKGRPASERALSQHFANGGWERAKEILKQVEQVTLDDITL